MPSHASRCRLVRRAAVVVPALIGALLVVPPGVARAETQSTGGLVASVAFAAGQSSEPPAGRVSVVLPDGDVLLGGTITQATTFGDTVLQPNAPGRTTDFVARYSADGSQVRWVQDFTQGARPTALVVSGDVLVVSLAGGGDGNGTFSGLTYALDLASGALRWGGTYTDACSPQSLAAGPDGSVVVATSTRASDYWSNGHCNAALRSLDAATGALQWTRLSSGSGTLYPSHVVVSPDGGTFVSGLLTGSVSLGGLQFGTASSCASREVLVALGPDGTGRWVRSSVDACYGYPGVDDLLLTPDGLYAWAQAPLAPVQPNGPVNWLVALDPATGEDLWQHRMPFGRTLGEFPEAGALASGPDGSLTLAAPFQGRVDLGVGLPLVASGSDGSYDAAVVTVRQSDGAVQWAASLGGDTDKRVWDVARSGAEILLTGSLDVLTQDGSRQDGVAWARVHRRPSLTLDIAPVGVAHDILPVYVAAESGQPVAVTGSSVCSVSPYGEHVAMVRLDHAGTCVVTATQDLGEEGVVTVSVSVAVRQLVPTVEFLPGSLVWPQPVPADLHARFYDGSGNTLPGDVTYTPAPGSVLEPGSHAVTASFQSADPDVEDMSAAGTLVVNRATPVIAWQMPDQLVYGTPVPASWLSAQATGVDGAPVPGSFGYTTPIRSGDSTVWVSAAGRVVDAGDHDIQAHFASDDSHYGQAYTSRSFTVTKAATRLDARFGKLQGQLTAVLRDTSNATTLPGQAVVFYFGSKSCTVLTDATGTATCTLSALDYVTARRRGVNAIYGGSSNHEQASAWLPAG